MPWYLVKHRDNFTYIFNVPPHEVIKCKVTSKGKDVPVLDQVPRYEEVWGSGGISPRILNFVTRWR